jgi:hypothetical protein
MRFIRSAATTLTLAGAATVAAFVVPGLTAPAFAQGPVVDVSPSTAAPGESVTFTITCDSTMAGAATLTGTTLGLTARIPMNPTSQSAQFTVTVTLPKDIVPGHYSPALDCDDGTARTGSLTVNPVNTTPVIDVTPLVAAPGDAVTFAITCGSGATSSMLYGTTLGLSEHIPMETSTHAGEFVTTVDLPTSISPGNYSPSIDCNNGVSGTAGLTVNHVPRQPSGAPLTGDGTTSLAMGGPFATAGLGLLGAGGLAVGVGVIRKRRRGGTRS